MDRIFGCFTKFLEKKNFSTFAQITLLHECLLKLNTLLLSMYKLLKSDLVFFPPRFERICLATSDTFFIVLSLAKKLVMRDKGEWLTGRAGLLTNSWCNTWRGARNIDRSIDCMLCASAPPTAPYTCFSTFRDVDMVSLLPTHTPLHLYRL